MKAVRAHLHRLPCRTVFVDPSEPGWKVLRRWDGDQEAVLGKHHFSTDLSSITAAYLRPVPTMVGDRDAASVLETVIAWADTAQALVVNRPSAMTLNNSKPLQSRTIREYGFETPATLITTDPASVRRFAKDHESIVCKSLSGARSVVWRLTDVDDPALDDVRWCPTQFQAYIPGDDYRAHVVRSVVHTTRVVSEADDYRYASWQNASAWMQATRLPDEVEARVVGMTEGMGLSFAGIDLRLSPRGQWFCFEVNPSPGFTFYERKTGQPIGEAVARMLANPS